MKSIYKLSMVLSLLSLFIVTSSQVAIPDDPNPPDHPVKLIFIHHSTGENWLRDDYGGLGRALAENNYFVSDTNYGWGPNSIGDRTDIPNWTEWFAGDQTPAYLDALFNESGQNASYTRLFGDPGGENQVMLFKSCFPNSALEGSPGDPPDPDGWLTVGHAKYVYNQILGYFATRPDKLFVVITAPPLSDSTYAANARAFNNWLLEDWLSENSYTLPNVAVFDFYNVLTARDAHHRFQAGRIEHLVTGRNTLFYPSDDDHPSAAGSQKATEEFLPLLNVFYHRWAAFTPSEPPAGEPNPPAVATTGPDAHSGDSALPAGDGLLADFETLAPNLAAYWDETTITQIACAPAGDAAYRGNSALRIDFDVAAGSWSTCVLSFENQPDWSAGRGLAFALHASRQGFPYNVILYAGSPEDRRTYINAEETPQDSSGGWATIEIPWSDFHRAEWEADAGTPFSEPERILEVAFGFDGQENANSTGTVWVDDLTMLGTTAVPAADAPQERRRGLPSCLGSSLLPLLLAGTAWSIHRRR
jgi:hypothetical protein